MALAIPFSASFFPLVLCLAAPAVGLAQQEPVVQFEERSLELGLDHQTLSGFDGLTNGNLVVQDWAQSGVAFGDLDGDGDADLVACGSLLRNHLFLNPAIGGGPEGTWEEIGEAAGIRSSYLDRMPALGDYDRDGDLDLFIGAMEGPTLEATTGRSRLLENDGTAHFTDVTQRAGTAGRGRTIFAIWFDLDLDGWLDLYTGEFNSAENAFYHNQADGTFDERAVAAGLADDGNAHACGIAYLNDDPYPDVVVGNDWLVGNIVGLTPEQNPPDDYLVANGDDTFTSQAVQDGMDQARGIMGLAFADVNYDGLMDVYKTDIGANYMLVQDPAAQAMGDTLFQNRASSMSVPGSPVPFLDKPGFGLASGWAAIFFDIDLDSYEDLYVVNGHVAGVKAGSTFFPRDERNFMYRSLGPAANYRFGDVTNITGLLDFYDDRAAAIGDIDGDGDFDLAVVETVGRLRFFENKHEHAVNGYISLTASGTNSAIGGEGVRVHWTDSQGDFHQRVLAGDAPTASTNEVRTILGVGSLADVDLTVEFPSGLVLDYPDVARNSTLHIVEPEIFLSPPQTLPALGSGGDLNDRFTVELLARSVDGTPLGAGATVAIEVPGLTADGPVVDLGDGRYTRDFLTDAAPGEYRVEVDLGGFIPVVRPVLNLIGDLDVARSSVFVVPEGLRSGSGEEAVITVVPRDASGKLIGPGQTVQAAISWLTGPVLLADQGDGTYQVSLVAPATSSMTTVRIRVNDILLDSTPQLQVGEVADFAATEWFVQSPIRIHAAGPDFVGVKVTPRDAQGRLLGPGAAVELVPRAFPSGPGVRGPAGAVGTRGSGNPAAGVAPSAALTTAQQAAGSATPSSPTLGQVGVEVDARVEQLGRNDGSFIFSLEVEEWGFELHDEVEVEIWVDGALLGVRTATLENPGA